MKIDIDMGYLCVMLGAGLLGVYFIFIPYISPNFNSQYKIYKEECHNESLTEYYTPAEGIPMDCPIINETVPCYDKNGNEIINVKCKSIHSLGNSNNCFLLKTTNETFILTLVYNRENYNDVYVLINFYDFKTLTLFPQYFYTSKGAQIFPFKIETITQKCEKKEVKPTKLYYANQLCWKENISENDFLICSALLDEKSDLTESWLNENCQLKRCTTCDDLGCQNQKCDMWECGVYEVIKNET